MKKLCEDSTWKDAHPAFTYDLWHSRCMKEYFTMTAHWIEIGGSVGNLVKFLGVAMGAGWHRAVLVPVSQLSARTSVCALGGLQPGTNELIGEDLVVIIRLDASQ